MHFAFCKSWQWRSTDAWKMTRIDFVGRWRMAVFLSRGCLEHFISQKKLVWEDCQLPSRLRLTHSYATASEWQSALTQSGTRWDSSCFITSSPTLGVRSSPSHPQHKVREAQSYRTWTVHWTSWLRWNFASSAHNCYRNKNTVYIHMHTHTHTSKSPGVAITQIKLSFLVTILSQNLTCLFLQNETI